MDFLSIPSTLRVPGTYTEFDDASPLRGLVKQFFKNLLIGQKTSAGTATANVPVKFTSKEQAKALFGPGSMLALMAQSALANDPVTELWAIPLADNGGGVAAHGTVTFTGPATVAGTLSFRFGDHLVEVGVDAGDADTDLATALAAAITADTDLPFTAVAASAVVTYTAKNKGTIGNKYLISINFFADEATPAGVGVTIVQPASGATDPSLTAAISGMGETQYNLIAFPYITTSPLNTIEAELNDRWGPLRAIDGHLIGALDDTQGNLTTLGAGRNSKHSTIVGVHSMPTPGFKLAAAIMGSISISAQNDPALPFQTLVVKDVLGPALASRFTLEERNQLLHSGIATVKFDEDGTTRVERLITTYQTSSGGAPDTSFLDLEPKLVRSFLRYDWRAYLANKYPRFKIADDGNRFGSGQKVMTPSLGKSEAVSRFVQWETAGLVENLSQFKNDLIVERNADDPNRMDWRLAPDLINQARIFGTQMAPLI